MNRLTTRQRLFIFYPIATYVLALILMQVELRLFQDSIKNEVASATNELQRSGMSEQQSQAIAALVRATTHSLSSLSHGIGFLAVIFLGSALIPINSAIVNLQVRAGASDRKL